ncbi:hypothetical protein CSB45_16030 [candidate division KSB3 bacterium]|uniref:Uncharacterized protein n=1 Tax=candidate division KSB3 bacterium TaxID=2044937 RepID=A0A2G6E113_9BACT|nr:MAG: hypothetical protein CSB45_16030 [candidate division KSB3 bacterium]
MQWKTPQNSKKYFWTEHAKQKMQQHGLSGQRVVRVIRKPLRTEESIAGNNVVAVMQPQSTKRDADGTKTWSAEIWVMYKIVDNPQEKAKQKASDAPDAMAQFLHDMRLQQKQIRIISAWRYPGKTTPGEPLPEEIADEIAEIL